ncbi:MAG: HPr family phosphocarrier protein [Clostridiales bacterium]|jgi:phosphocarrier protein|nr:HPr family phosphocarrier protein [Clostridiales bacterium]
MYSKNTKIDVPVGLHARPAMYLIQRASNFKSTIWLEYDQRRANAKSLLGILSLGVTNGSDVRITAEGSDEIAAVSDLISLVESNFAENTFA